MWMVILIGNLLTMILGIFGFAVTATPGTSSSGGSGTLPGIL
jgi:hypothetical protein